MHVAVINRSFLTDEEALEITRALDRQVQQHFKPAWGYGALLSYVDHESTSESSRLWLLLTTTSDDATADGYHDYTPWGQPISKVFVDTCRMENIAPSWSASWELLSMLANPELNTLVEIDGDIWAVEPCSPCGYEGYDIGGITVANFVHPSYYDTEADGYLDHLNKVLEPSQTLPGGYLEQRVGLGAWKRVGASQMLPNERPRVGSRPERRRTPREDWCRSNPSSLPVAEEVITTVVN